MKRFVGLTLLALILIGICVRAASWQYDRHVTRSEFNKLIESNIQKPTLAESDLVNLSQSNLAWRQIKMSGTFQPQFEILIRNRYHNGEYGFGVITLFQSDSGKKYWVDRGWVKAGPDAKTPPKITPVNSKPTSITGRIHIEEINQSIAGTLFAMPRGDGTSELQKWNNQIQVDSEPIYLDLEDSAIKEFVPEYPTLLPELSNGPHLAYTLQWIIFAALVVIGYSMIIREDYRERKAIN